jgi:hypothetical protein
MVTIKSVTPPTMENVRTPYLHDENPLATAGWTEHQTERRGKAGVRAGRDPIELEWHLTPAAGDRGALPPQCNRQGDADLDFSRTAWRGTNRPAEVL